MSTGLWLVFCPASRAIGLEEVQRMFEREPRHTMTLAPDRLEIAVEHRDGTSRVVVTTASGASVLAEAAAVAEIDVWIDVGVPMPDEAQLRASDFCYRVAYELDDHEIVYNTIFILGTELMSECHGIAVDRVHLRYV